MNFRKNSILIIGGGIALALLVVAVIFLVKNQSAYRDQMAELNNQKNRLQALNQRVPFPSADNVALSQQNLEFSKERFGHILDTIQNEQINPETIEPARFAPLLEEAFRRVRQKAVDANVQLPTDPGLGFKDYAAGKLPPNDPAVLERLVLQIKTLEDLISIMIESKVQSIDSIERNAFETKAQEAEKTDAPEVRGRGRGVVGGRPEGGATTTQQAGLPMTADTDLYKVERFSIGITGRESAIWEALNRLASRKVMYVVVDVSMENSKMDHGKPVDMKARLASMTQAQRQGGPAAVAGLPQPTLDSLSRDERVIGGREPVRAKIVVDMYRYPETAAAEVAP